MILSLIFCDVISSSLFRSPTVAPLVARQPFLKIAYSEIKVIIFKTEILMTSEGRRGHEYVTLATQKRQSVL